MKLVPGIFFVVMIAAGFLLAPAMLVWGWIRYFRRMDKPDHPFFLAFIGFLLSTASAVLAIGSIGYAVVTHGFAYYDPRLLRIFRWGVLLSLGGACLGLTGVARPQRLKMASSSGRLGHARVLGYYSG